jgi:pseudouridine kinase
MDIVAQTSTLLEAADSTPGHILCAPGGVARNVAENLARLGHTAQLVSAVGDDVFGISLLQSTQNAGVLVAAVACLPTQRTATYLSLHGPDGDMAVAVNDMGILKCLTPSFLQAHTELLQSAVCTVLDCNLQPESLAWLLADPQGVPQFVDAVSAVKCTRIAPFLAGIHTLKVNRLEAQTLSGQGVQSVAEALSAAIKLHQMGVRNVVVSLGEQGVCWCDAQGQSGHLPIVPIAVVNTSGAGDALLSGLVHGFLCGMSMHEAVKFAMACAEVTLSSTFANAPDLSVATVLGRLSLRSPLSQ